MVRRRKTRMTFCQLNVLAMGLAAGIMLAVFMLFLGILSGVFGIGTPLVELYASFYVGFANNVLGMIIGTLWGFVYGFLMGIITAWLYNWFRYVTRYH